MKIVVATEMNADGASVACPALIVYSVYSHSVVVLSNMCWWPNCGIEGGDMKPHLLTSIVTFMSWSWVLAESDECPAQYEENCPSQSESACIPYNESDPSVFMYTVRIIAFIVKCKSFVSRPL